jgi:hypothetical protein
MRERGKIAVRVELGGKRGARVWQFRRKSRDHMGSEISSSTNDYSVSRQLYMLLSVDAETIHTSSTSPSHSNHDPTR